MMLPLYLMLLVEAATASRKFLRDGLLAKTTAEMAVVLQAKRASNVCPSGGYTADNGLKFTTDNLCLHNLSGDDINTVVASSLEDCMSLCSGTGTGLCAGVAFTISNGNCWLKNETIISNVANAVSSSDTNSAVVSVGSTKNMLKYRQRRRFLTSTSTGT